MIGWILASCVHDPGTWDPIQTGDTAATTADTAGLPAIPASPPGWGSCGTLRSALSLSGLDDDVLHEVSPAPGGASDLLGSFDGPLTLDPGGPRETTLVPMGESAELLARYEADGSLAWVRHLDGTSQSSLRAIAAATSEKGPDGDVFVAGSGDVLSSFDAEPPLSGLGEADAFVARFGPEGELLWTRSFGSTDDDYATALAALPDGGVLVGGSFGGPMVLGQGELAETTLALPDGARSAAFFARYTADGALVWALSIGGADYTTLSALVYDAESDTILIHGDLAEPGATVFGAGTAQERAIEPIENETYVARYAGDGRFQWVSSVGGTYVRGAGIDLLPGGAALVAGWTLEEAIFARGEPEEQLLTSLQGGLAWVARYEPDGRLGWVTSASSPDGVYAYDLAALPTGGVALLGSFRGEVVLGEGEPGQIRWVSSSGVDGLLAIFDADGRLGCALQLQTLDGETTSALSPEALVLRADGSLEVVGKLDGSAVLGEGTAAEVMLTSVESDGLRLIIDLLAPPG